AVAEEALAQAHAAHLQALELERGEPLADDELGAAAADVHHQAPAGLARHGVRDARINESRLLHAGDDLDGMSERLAGALEEGLLAMGDTEGIRSNDTDAVRTHVAQPLAKTLQTRQSTRRHLLVDAAILLNSRGQAHHLTQTVDDDELAVRIPRHDQMETVGAEVYRGEDVGNGMRRRLRVRLLAVADGSGRAHAVRSVVRR